MNWKPCGWYRKVRGRRRRCVMGIGVCLMGVVGVAKYVVGVAGFIVDLGLMMGIRGYVRGVGVCSG